MRKKKFVLISIILIIAIIVSSLISLNLGVISISPSDVWKTIIGDGTDQQELVLFQFRLPGIILALLIGMGLAVSGAVLQSITQNELAEPGIIGINAGAGLSIVLFIYFFQQNITADSPISIFIMPVFALAGAFIAALLIYLLSWRNGISPIRLILVGIGVNAGFHAGLIIFQLKMDPPQDFRQVTVWLTGDIWSANWTFVYALLPWIILLIPLVIWKANTLNVMNLTDSVASSLGTKVERERLLLLLLAVALAGGASVAAGGGIAFLGLIAPHIARRIIGPMHQLMIPISALIGAFIVISADIVAENLFSPTTLPVGVIIALMSAPYFIYLLLKT
ncbi:ABC-type Fe3+-siderophore transport system [Gracilibacillus boraciitolerans JCM 21714]|uniref:ABC-type Fe3+-siderophore transport system n=1 Tax=Gracilibacillus boraciitolerans JCM 21714 TaxID=1298598 RepID=W4VH63_9BACI|nr:iron ABC transporter permease [Gracilibacillus boraciitolerans]GAE92099.1 ABC-type Fe3+-siderophore transport system [Gracilibacillus boraciitolerans JCM 21714]